MDLKKYLPEGAFVLVGALGVSVTGYNLLADASGNFIGFLVLGSVGVFATVKLIKKLKNPTV